MWRTVGKVSFNPAKIIGKGNFGLVFAGLLKDETKKVAVKRLEKVQVDHSLIKREAELMMQLKNHSNILRYICCEADDDFLYIVTELCAGTLEDLVEGKYQEPKVGDEKEIMYQVTKGLTYLHRQEIVHRDIKPNNILISIPKRDRADVPQMRLADFGISKSLKADKDDFTNTNVTNPHGSKGWMAPELYLNERHDFKVDIFSLGCVFAYTLTGGKHPFGVEGDERTNRIKKKEAMLLVPKDLKKPYSSDRIAMKLIKHTLDMKPARRPTAVEVFNHDFFSDNRQKSLHNWERMIELLNLGSSSTKLTDDEFVKFIQLVDDENVDVDVKDRDGWNPLLRFCQNYDHDNLVDLVKVLIEKGADVSVKTPDGWTALHCLCNHYTQTNLINIASHIFTKKGIDINAKNDLGWSPLHYLCRFYKHDNLIDLVRLFIRNGAYVHTKTPGGSNLLHFLCKYYKHDNLLDLIRLLLSNQRVDGDARDEDGWTPLHYLCHYYEHDNLIDLVHMFKEKRLDINVMRHPLGKNPLLLLCEYYKHSNLFELIQLFMELDQDLYKSKTPYGRNALHLLCFNYKHDNLIDLIRLFIEKGLDVNAKTPNGFNPLHFLCEYYRHDNLIEIVKLFIERGNADVKTKDCWNGRNLLHILCENYKHGNIILLIQLLIEKGCPVNAQDAEGWNPLQLLCRHYGNDDLIHLVKRLVLEEGIDVHSRNRGWSPLLLLCRHYVRDNLIELIEVFIKEQGVDINVKTSDGWNPLHILCRYYIHDNLIDLIRLMKDEKIDLTAKTDEGYTVQFLLSQNPFVTDEMDKEIEIFLMKDDKSKKCRLM